MSANDAGLSVPDDLSLLGVDDSYIGRMTRPALSTIAFDLAAEAGRLAGLITGWLVVTQPWRWALVGVGDRRLCR